MDTPPEPTDAPDPEVDPSADGAPRRPRSTARLVAISVCIALVGALLAGLVTSLVIGGDDDPGPAAGATDLDLGEPIDTAELLGVELLHVDGTPTSLGELLTDKPAVVNLWAQSCAPCVKEMPLLEAAAKANPDVDVIGVDTQDQLDRALVLAQRTGITYPWVQDPDGDFFYAARAAGMPTTLAVSPDGEVLAAKTGTFTSEAELQRWIDGYLG
ncbi:MAG: TlpA family protein disulfide reductase [Actinobacteria bacterium]|nr:TlpA family protein disulfide reductase [Actinomycetota bacterium]